MQGEALSTVLFSMYINDFEYELIKGLCEPIYLQDISLFLLIYTDDTVLLSETAGDLQKMIDTLHTYSSKWNLSVNTEKTKMLYLEIVRNCLPKKNGFIIISLLKWLTVLNILD